MHRGATMQSTHEMVTAEGRIAVARDRPSAGLVSWGLWIPAIAATMAYPVAVNLFVNSYHAAKVGSVAWGLCATAALALACAVPVLALRGLFAIRLATTHQAIAVRRLLHLAVAVPPLYLLSGRVSSLLSPLLGNAASSSILWWGFWLILGLLVWNSTRRRAFFEPRGTEAAGDDSHRGVTLSSARVRSIHRAAVIAIVMAFLVMHLANHLVALWSVSWQRAMMLALRSWYRTAWMEPVVLGLFVAAAVSGLFRLARLTRGAADGFRVLQTASAAYLACFLVSHLWATLGARYRGIDSDWAFATGGKAGLLASGWSTAVLIYYAFALLAVAIHAGLGLRMLLLSNRVQTAAANRAARLTVFASSVISILIVAALIGVRLGR